MDLRDPLGRHLTPDHTVTTTRAVPVGDTTPILEVDDLSITFQTAQGPIRPVRGVSFSVRAGEILGLVGESGAGKSLAALATMGLLPPHAVVSGSVRYRGRELLHMGPREKARLRGDRIAMVFQDPVSSLDPIRRVGAQVAEAIRIHHPDVGRGDARARAVELLSAVGLPEARRRARDYPHQLSAGMCQRVMLASAMANDPDVLVADEPTSALDVTIQAQVLDLLKTLNRTRDLAIVLVTHDLSVLSDTAHRVAVMYAGRIVERGRLSHVLNGSRHPYTRGLLAAAPRRDLGGAVAPAPIPGMSPSPGATPPGCAFHPRCSHAEPDCRHLDPVLRPVAEVETACLHAETLGANEAADGTT